MRKKKHKEGNSERWLLTYADMLTLLFVLFVLLFAISNVDSAKFKSLSGSLNSALGNGTGAGNSILQGGGGLLDGGTTLETEAATEATTQSSSANSTEGKEQVSQQTAEQAQMKDLKNNIDKVITANNLGGDIGINVGESGLVITFPSNTFFDSGKADLKDNMKEALDKIAIELNSLDNIIQVKGYTDNVGIKNSIISSNWQLSADRAAKVVQYLVEEGHVQGSRLYAIGCGENNPIDTNDTPEGRSKNRRIEISLPYNNKEAIQNK